MLQLKYAFQLTFVKLVVDTFYIQDLSSAFSSRSARILLTCDPFLLPGRLIMRVFPLIPHTGLKRKKIHSEIFVGKFLHCRRKKTLKINPII